MPVDIKATTSSLIKDLTQRRNADASALSLTIENGSIRNEIAGLIRSEIERITGLRDDDLQADHSLFDLGIGSDLTNKLINSLMDVLGVDLVQTNGLFISLLDEPLSDVISPERSKIVDKVLSELLDIPTNRQDVTRPEKKEIFLRQHKRRISRLMDQFFDLEEIPVPYRSTLFLKIELLVSDHKKKISRPLWKHRFDHPKLGGLSAPSFLRLVHADDIRDDVVRKEEIRSFDPELMDRVESYISQREGRGADLGDAQGLKFVTSKPATNRRPEKRHPRHTRAVPQP